MAKIQVADLHSVGLDLFFDPESYLKELSEAELNVQGVFIKGGSSGVQTELF